MTAAWTVLARTETELFLRNPLPVMTGLVQPAPVQLAAMGAIALVVTGMAVRLFGWE